MNTTTPPMAPTTIQYDNGDEARSFGTSGAQYIGNFHKSLPHDDNGEVVPPDYQAFVAECDAVAAGLKPDFNGLQHSFPTGTAQAPLLGGVTRANVGPFINPAAGASGPELGPDPKDFHLGPAPKVDSLGTAAEIVELYWMALLRDVPFSQLSSHPLHASAMNEIRDQYQVAIDDTTDGGRLRLGLDLPKDASGNLRIVPKTLFRAGLPEEDVGPQVSQFFLHDAAYGTHRIEQAQIPYRSHRNFLTEYGTWLLAQNTAYDRHGRDYPHANHYSDDNGYFEPDLKRRRMRSMRDLARFVNRDALHQAYFDAALMLLSWNAPVDNGNPYKTMRHRDGGFGTLGGPHLLTLVSEVAARALHVIWRQKWLIHRRLRPEAYAGLAQAQFFGRPDGTKRDYGLPAWLKQTAAATRIRDTNSGAMYLPMAYSSGSPAHPSYGAGHATVAGACITVLKAWFDDGLPFQNLFVQTTTGGPQEPDGGVSAIVEPDAQGSKYLPEYYGSDVAQMTIGGELNKLAANVAFGRSMGGVHWRSDNTRSLRLGEMLAVRMMSDQVKGLPEQNASFSFKSFDGIVTTIASDGTVTPPLPNVVAPQLP